jgi:hypothetical protein
MRTNRWQSLWIYLRLALVVFLAMLLLQRSVLEPGNRSERVRAFTRSIEFDYLRWTIDAVGVKLGQAGLGAPAYLSPEEQRQVVLDYLALVEQIFEQESYLNDYYADPTIDDPEAASRLVREELDRLYARRQNLAPLAESILQDQLSATVADLGLSLGGQPVPPLLYHVTPLPKALVVSPRDTIRQVASISIQPDLTIDEIVELEEDVAESLDVSSLVVNIGGIGLYPTMVMQTTSLNWMGEVIAHEWVHNFLTLRPLGANYNTTPELRIINETTASIADQEIRDAFIERYYPELIPPPPPPPSEDEEAEPEPPAFDFRAEMHETRLTVDEMLADGEIEAAEAYMESRRQLFWEQGYRIRKLNQAYFAFYGAYAAQPGGARGASGGEEDNIGEAVRQLRAQSPSLAAFLNRISWIWSFEQLQNAVQSTDRS